MSSHSNVPVGGHAPPFDATLLQPIVRSKRTPIACKECRRRQVKCSGNRPRCDRCEKKNVDCEYVPLSEQRAGGSISRSGTPQGSDPHTSSGHSSRYVNVHAPEGWQSHGYHPGAGSGTYSPASAQGWRPTSPASAEYGARGTQANNQGYAGMAFMEYAQGGANMEGYAPAQGGYASYPTNANAYGHAVPATDPRYAYAQQAALPDHQQSAPYMDVDQFGQQMFIDQATGQLISADVARQWMNNHNSGLQGQNYPGQN